MKKLILLIFSAFLSFPAFGATVLISQTAEHPALNLTTKGIIDGLKKQGFEEGKNLTLRVETAQANSAIAAQIAAKFAAQNPDVVVGVGTLSSQSFLKYASLEGGKLVFSTVTDPQSAGLIQKDKQISGVSNFVNLEEQLKLFRKVQPNLKNLGVLYNPGESNSVAIIQKLEKICPTLGLTLMTQAAPQTKDVAQATTKLVSQVDAIFISNDNTALSALPVIIHTAMAQKIPVYVSDTDAVELGALAALGPNQYDIGLQTSVMIARALKGEDLSKMPVEYPTKSELWINFKTTKDLGITIPKDLIKRADHEPK